VALSIVFVAITSCAIGMFLSTLPAPDEFPRAAMMATFDAERAVAQRKGYGVADVADSSTDEAGTDRWSVELAAGECLAAIAGVAGYQAPFRLTIGVRSGDETQALSVYDAHERGRVLHAQWCTDDAASVVVELERRFDDVYGRAGHTRGVIHRELLRAPADRTGGIAGIERGRLTDRALSRAGRVHLFDRADRERPPNARAIVDVPIEPFEARLVPEDRRTYAMLWVAARNGTNQVVNPRFTPLPASVDPALLAEAPATRTMEALRSAHLPNEHPTETHPAVRAGESGMERVLAVVNAGELPSNCVVVQLVRKRYGYRTAVSRYAPQSTDARAVRTEENVAIDRLCASDGIVFYTTSTTDQERYALRIYPAR
jgi:hypothetical protein